MKDTYWDYDGEVERCSYCHDVITDTSHDQCKEKLSEYNYSDRLTYGFKLLDMEE